MRNTSRLDELERRMPGNNGSSIFAQMTDDELYALLDSAEDAEFAEMTDDEFTMHINTLYTRREKALKLKMTNRE